MLGATVEWYRNTVAFSPATDTVNYQESDSTTKMTEMAIFKFLAQFTR